MFRSVVTVCLFIFIFSFSVSFAETEADSLISLLETTPEPEKSSIYNDLAKKFLYVDLEKSAQYNEKAIEFSRKYNISEDYAKAIHFKAVLLINKGRYPEALEFQLKALSQFRSINLRVNEAHALNNLGYLYSRFGQYEKALDYYDQSYKIRQEMDDVIGMTKSRSNIALMNYELGEYEKSLGYELEALRVFEEGKDTVAMIVSINSIGNIYDKLDSLDLAEKYYSRSLKIARQKNHLLQIIPALNNLGNIYIRTGSYGRAEDIYKECLDLSKQQDEQYFIAVSVLNLGNLNLIKKRYSEAKKHILQAKDMFVEMEYNDMVAESYDYLKKMYQEQGNFKLAIAYSDSSKLLAEKINSEKMREKTSQMQAVIETEAKVKDLQKLIELHNYELQKKTLLIYAGAGAILAIIIITLLLYNRTRILERSRHEREQHISDLEDALEKVKLLSGLIPICSNCKKIRDDKGYWNQIESYIRDHSEAEFTHGICPECSSKLYPEYKS